MAKKKKIVKRQHRWSGAGYVCADCGCIKDTSTESPECPGSGKTGFDVWLYHAGAGWWLSDSELDSLADATRTLKDQVGTENIVAGAVLPAGQPLGLFTKQMTFK